MVVTSAYKLLSFGNQHTIHACAVITCCDHKLSPRAHTTAEREWLSIVVIVTPLLASVTPLLAGVGKVLLYEVPSLSVPGGSGAMRLGYRSFTYLY